jgi:hypothetical protein
VGVDPLDRIAERKLAEALERGELDDYAGKGEPLPPDDLAGVPAELRSSYILLKGAGLLPEELELKQDLVRLDTLIAACHADGERETLRKTRSARALQLALLMEKRGSNAAWYEFAERIDKRIGGEPR